jgi:hypothetical protein
MPSFGAAKCRSVQSVMQILSPHLTPADPQEPLPGRFAPGARDSENVFGSLLCVHP